MDYLLRLNWYLCWKKNKLKVANTEYSTLGQNHFSSLEAMLNKSCSALMVVSKKFLKSKRNLYDVNQAVITELQHENFKVVFLLCERLNNWGKIPKNLRLVLNSATTVNKYEKDWQNDVVYEVTRKTEKFFSLRNKLPKLLNGNFVDVKRRYSISGRSRISRRVGRRTHRGRCRLPRRLHLENCMSKRKNLDP